MKNKYNFKLKFSVISLVFAIITIAFSICMIVFSSKESFGIAKAEWLDFLFAGIASIIVLIWSYVIPLACNKPLNTSPRVKDNKAILSRSF